MFGKASETNTAFHFIKIVKNYRARESTFQSLMRGEDTLPQPPSANELQSQCVAWFRVVLPSYNLKKGDCSVTTEGNFMKGNARAR